MLLKAEFDENMSNLERSVDDMLAGGEGKILNLILAALQYNGLNFAKSFETSIILFLTRFSFSDIMSSQKLQDLFYMVLMAGNFLNSVSTILNFLNQNYNRYDDSLFLKLSHIITSIFYKIGLNSLSLNPY